jgi:hypothetical protein
MLMMSVARLRLASRPSLEDLETNQSQQVSPNRLHQSQEKSPDQASIPKRHCHVGQILYAKDVQKNYPSWKKWVANRVHIPLFRWFEKILGLFPPTGKRIIDGVYVWNAHQGCFSTQEEADRDAARYPHGYVVPNVPVGSSLTADAAEESSIYFASKGKEDIPTSVVLHELDEARREAAKVKAAVHTARVL